MNAVAEPPFVDRRNYETGVESHARERRQFTNSHEGLSAEARIGVGNRSLQTRTSTTLHHV